MFTSGGKTEWQPSLVETQVLRIGRLFVNAVPGEFTTMSGRRLLKAVHEVRRNDGDNSVSVNKSPASCYVVVVLFALVLVTIDNDSSFNVSSLQHTRTHAHRLWQ